MKNVEQTSGRNGTRAWVSSSVYYSEGLAAVLGDDIRKMTQSYLGAIMVVRTQDGCRQVRLNLYGP